MFVHYIGTDLILNIIGAILCEQTIIFYSSIKSRCLFAL